MSDHTTDFKQMLVDGGVPTDSAEMGAIFDQVVDDSGVTINNDSPYSPFWRAVRALVTVPAQWLISAMISHILPNLFIKTATGIFLDMLAWALDVTRKPATVAAGTLHFTRSTNAGTLDIPQGTIVQTDPINGVVYQVETTQAATFDVGVSTLPISVRARGEGADFNLGAGYFNHLLEPISGVTVTNLADWLLSPGDDPESDEDLRLRCRNQFSAPNEYHTDAVYLKIITTFAGIGIKNVFFDRNAPRGPGSADAYILLGAGEPSAPMITDIASHIMANGNHGLGDDVQVFAMPGVDHDLVTNVWFKPNLGVSQKTQLLLDIEVFIRAAFRENTSYTVTTTMPHSTFSFSNLGKELHVQFPALQSVNFDLSDFTNGLNVGRLGSLSVIEQ